MLASHAQLALEQLKLCHILNGETCPPISFADFATFLTNKDHTAENLVFVLWYRDYKSKWKQVDKAVKVRVPVPSTSLGHRCSPFGYLHNGPVTFPTKIGEQGVEESRNRSTSASAYSTDAAALHLNDSSGKPLKSYFSRVNPHFSGSRLRASSLACSSSPALPVSHQSHPPYPPGGTTFLSVEEQPLRDQALRAFATFLKKGGSKELSISDELREYVRTCLEVSTAPESFLPVLEEIYHILESQCLPRFLETVKANINRPKQLFWYFAGIVDLLIGLTIFLLLTFLLPPRPFGLRTYRLFSTIFVSFGIMQVYSAYRGFCSQVWRRSSRQVWPWELDELEDENSKVGDTMGRPAIVGCEPKPEMRELKEIVFPEEVRPLSNLGAIENFDPTCKVNIRILGNSISASQTPLVKSGDYDLSDQTFGSRIAIVEQFVPICDTSFLGDKLGSISPLCCMRLGILAAEGHKLPNPVQRRISPFAFDSGGEGETSLDNVIVTTALPHSVPVQPLHPLTSSMLISNPRSTKHETRVPPRRKGHTKIQVFGPEKLIEDPRIKKVYKDIKRDILIVGGIVSALWIVVCLVVPCTAS